MVETNTQHQPNKDDTVVFLTRHGARIDSDDHRWLAKCSHNRANDPHLSPAGEIGAVELAQKMKELQTTEDGWKMLHIVSSPYIRCIETAHAVAQALNASIKVEPGIAEVNSSRHPNFLDAVELKQKFPSIDTSYIPSAWRWRGDRYYSLGMVRRVLASLASLDKEGMSDTRVFQSLSEREIIGNV